MNFIWKGCQCLGDQDGGKDVFLVEGFMWVKLVQN